METSSLKLINRKSFVRSSAGLIAGFSLIPLSSVADDHHFADEINIIGPRAGYSTQLGTFVSMMDWMRESVIRAVNGLSQAELDFLIDPAIEHHWRIIDASGRYGSDIPGSYILWP